MCFYVKRHLDYVPHARPSYVVAREREAQRGDGGSENGSSLANVNRERESALRTAVRSWLDSVEAAEV